MRYRWLADEMQVVRLAGPGWQMGARGVVWSSS